MNIGDKEIHSEEQCLLSQAKQMLEEESQHLDYKTVMGLEKSRQKALQQTPLASKNSNINADGSISLKQYFPGSLIAISLLLALTFYTFQNYPTVTENPLTLYSDLELLGAQEPLEFYENIEFYDWLELNE